MKKLIVDKNYDGKKLNKFLFCSIPSLSSNLFYKILRKKDIKVNNKRVHENVVLHEGDEVIIYIPESNFSNFKLNVFYEDENILVVNKPINIEVTGDNSLTTFANAMPCHRIDRNTTGLVLFAKNEASLNILLNKFKNGEIEKHYLAYVYGIPKVNKKRCEAYLFKDTKKSRVYISDSFKKGYQKIITTYTVIKKNNDNSCLLDVEIETGRTHQIRAHLAHMGLPIIGDR